MPRARKPGSGGARTGTPGVAYSNRSDLNRPGVGQTYGTASAQQSAMSAVPISAPSAGVPMPAQAPAVPQPGSGGPFNRPSERPGEPVTAGLPLGPGPGPEALGTDLRDTPAVAELRALYAMFPDPDLADLLEDADHGVTF